MEGIRAARGAGPSRRWLVLGGLCVLTVALVPFDRPVLDWIYAHGINVWMDEHAVLRWLLQAYARFFGSAVIFFAILILQRSLRRALAVALICSLVGLGVGVVKVSLGRARPETHASAFGGPGPGLSDPAHRSFPSGHMGNAVANSILLWHFFPGQPVLTVAACTLTAIVGVERIAQGKHYPSDVVGGIWIAWLLTGWLLRWSFTGRVVGWLAWPLEAVLRRLSISVEDRELPAASPVDADGAVYSAAQRG